MPPLVDVVVLDGVSRWFGRGGGRTVALAEVSVGFAAGSFTAVVGASGSGKSTLLHCAAGLDRPSSGRVLFEGRSIEGLAERRLTRLRQQRMGFVFQSYNLVPALSVADNVSLPLRLRGQRPSRRRIEEALGLVGLTDQRRARPDELSGGQQQRTAIARALVTDPAVIFADEPTGALDIVSARGVLTLLREASDRDGRTVIVVTHDPVSAAAADRVLFMADGRLRGEAIRPSPEQVATRLTALITTTVGELA